MKVQCDKCEATYNIPDDKIPEGAVKLRCLKCPNTILLNKDKPEHTIEYSEEPTENVKSKFQQDEIENDVQSDVKGSQVQCEKSKIAQIGNNLKGKVERIKNDLNQQKCTDGEEYRNKSNKSFIGKIEQKILFNYTRVLALISIGFLIICLIIGVIAFFNVGNDSFVTYKDVDRSLNPPEKNAYKTIQDRFPEVKIPNNALRYFSDGENKKVMTGWLSGLEKGQKKDFLTNLEYIIDEAEDENPNKVVNYINGYKSLKFAKIKSDQFDKYFQTATKVGIIALILFLMGIIGLFSLVLVVLAVERNTRPKLQIE